METYRKHKKGAVKARAGKYGQNIYLDRCFAPKQSFLSYVNERSDVTLELVDFRSKPLKGVCQQMAAYDPRHKDRISRSLLHSMNKMVVVSSVKMNVQRQHRSAAPPLRAVKAHHFYRGRDSFTLPVRYVSVLSHFRMCCVGELDARLLCLPYVGDHQMLYILLPNNKDGLADMEKRLDDPDVVSRLFHHMENMDRRLVKVEMPQFDICAAPSLRDILHDLGSIDLFCSRHIKGAFISFINYCQ